MLYLRGMETLLDIAGFAGKALLLTLALGTLIILIANLIAKFRPPREQLEVENLGERFEAFADAIQEASSDPKALKAARKIRDKAAKNDRGQKFSRPRLFVLDFDGDIRATGVAQLRDEVTAVLAALKSGDEVLIRLESTGGTFDGYGLAAAQLMRLKSHGVNLTIAVDRVAASGGYMMACTANRIIAAPFAIVGSIGVIAQVPNLHRVLKRHDIDYEEITAGEFKRTVSMFAEITAKGRQKFVEQIEDAHRLFKDFVHSHRPQLDPAKVATGEYWYGHRALELNLVDELMSSDEFLFSNREKFQIFGVRIELRKKLSERISIGLSAIGQRAFMSWKQNLHDDVVLSKLPQ